MPYDGVSAIPEETPELNSQHPNCQPVDATALQRGSNQALPQHIRYGPLDLEISFIDSENSPALNQRWEWTHRFWPAPTCTSSVLILFDVVSNRQLALINVHLYISGPFAKCLISAERNTSHRRVARRHLHALNYQVLTTESGHLRFLL
jgi:hypothetical protein